MMKLGIIGASGFIGRSLIHGLNIPETKIVKFYQKLGDPSNGNETCRKLSIQHAKPADFKGIDSLILCASATNPITAGNNYLEETRKNVLPHIHLLNVLKETNIRHVIYLSSGGTVYGNQTRQPIDETCLINPLNPYGYGKVCIENAINAIWRDRGRRYTIIRPSNPVGRYQLQSLGAHGLVTTAYTKIKNGEVMTIHGDGSTVRDFFHVSDLCSLIDRILASNRESSVVINASSATGHSINQVIESLAHFLNIEPKLNYLPQKQPAIEKNVLCNKRACELFDWSPDRDINTIITLLDKELSEGVN